MLKCEWITKDMKLGIHCCVLDSQTVKENHKHFIENELLHSKREVGSDSLSVERPTQRCPSFRKRHCSLCDAPVTSGLCLPGRRTWTLKLKSLWRTKVLEILGVNGILGDAIQWLYPLRGAK